MDCRELRLGNWVHNTNKDVRVKSLSDDSFMSIVTEPNLIGATHGGDIQPIPLTEEWLVRLGFEVHDEYWWNIYSKKHDYDIQFLRNYENEETYQLMSAPDIEVPIRYVHQLQNIYFALTGEELKYV